MARVRDVEIDEVPEDVQPVYRRFIEEYGPFANQVKVFAHRPPVLKHIQGLLLDLAGEAVVDKRYLEIVLVVVSKLNKCSYCVAHHAPRLIDQGLGLETVERILEPDCPGLDEVDRLVRDFSVQVTQSAQTMREAIFERMRAQFSEAQIVELTVRIALCGFFNRVNDALQIGMEDGVVEDMLAHGMTHAHLKSSDAAE